MLVCRSLYAVVSTSPHLQRVSLKMSLAPIEDARDAPLELLRLTCQGVNFSSFRGRGALSRSRSNVKGSRLSSALELREIPNLKLLIFISDGPGRRRNNRSLW